MATLAELDALVDAKPDAARGIAAAYEILLGGVPSIDGFVFLINNATSTNFGSNNPNVTFNQENIFINLTNALVQGNPTAKANFDAIIAGEATLADKLGAIYDAFVPLTERTTEGRAFFTRPEAQTFYQQVAAERGVAGADGASIVALASLLKILVAEDIGVGDDVNDLIAAINDGSAALPTNGALTPIETADGTHFDNDENLSFNLTEGVDTVQGSDGDDVIRGDVVQTAFLPIQTLNSGDSVDGGAGYDKLTVQLVDFNVQPAALTSIEELNLESSPTVLGLVAGPRFLDAINADSIQTVGFRAPNANIITGLELANVSSDVTTINISDSQGLPFAMLPPVVHSIGFVGDTVRDSVTVNLSNVGYSGLFLDGSGYETVTVNSGGSVGNSLGLVVAEMETLNITGATDLEMLGFGFFDDLEVQPLALVDASTFTGDLHIDIQNLIDDGLDGINDAIEVRSGSGDDWLHFFPDAENGLSGFDSDVTVSGGGGDDAIDFYSTQSLSGVATFTATDSADGGAGDDELAIEVFGDGMGAKALLLAGVGTNIVGIERIVHFVAPPFLMQDDLTVDWTRKGSATELELAAEYNDNNVTVTGLTNGDTVLLTGDGILSLSLASLNGAGSLSNTINLTIETTDPLDNVHINGGLIVDPETELLNLVGTGAGTIEIDSVDQVDANVLITTTAALEFGLVGSAYDLDGGTIDGSASTGDLTIRIGAGNQSVAGGSGDDLILVDSILGIDADLIVLGAGGADTVSFVGAFAAGDPLANVNHVTGFSTDDVVQINDDGGFGNDFVMTNGAANVEPAVGRDIVAGENALLQASSFGFLKFTTAVAGAANADALFGSALGAGSVNTNMAAGDSILGLAYDSTAGQMVVFEVQNVAGGMVDAADTAYAIATLSMSYADFLAFDGANIDFTSVV